METGPGTNRTSYSIFPSMMDAGNHILQGNTVHMHDYWVELKTWFFAVYFSKIIESKVSSIHF